MSNSTAFLGVQCEIWRRYPYTWSLVLCTDCILNICIINKDATTYQSRDPTMKVVASYEKNKKEKQYLALGHAQQ